jgi:hypothetical protein
MIPYLLLFAVTLSAGVFFLTLLGQPRVPEVHCFTFRSQVDKSLPNYYMSIVDTPGVREVTNRMKDRKTSDEVTLLLQGVNFN